MKAFTFLQRIANIQDMISNVPGSDRCSILQVLLLDLLASCILLVSRQMVNEGPSLVLEETVAPASGEYLS